jgi:hypothetical protein
MEERRLGGLDAVKMVVQATLRTRSVDFRKQREFISATPASTVQRSCRERAQVGPATPAGGIPGDSVFGRRSAPFEGFLHKTNTLDTLGDDEPETPAG